MWRRLSRTPIAWLVLVALAGGAAFGLYWFQPWKLVVDERVDEALATLPPVASAPASPAVAPSAASSPVPATPSGPVLVAEGEWVSHEHATTGSVRLIREPDGGHQLELVDLDTSNEPDLRVWLTDQPVIEGEDGWHVFDDGAWVDLGELKGNQGNQRYAIPPEVELADYSSISIWCRRFAVSFGAAELSGVGAAG